MGWCPDCPDSEAFLQLQWMTAANPNSAENWNALAVWHFHVGAKMGTPSKSNEHEHFGLGILFQAAVAIAISKRLIQLQGLSSSEEVDANFAKVKQALKDGNVVLDTTEWFGVRSREVLAARIAGVLTAHLHTEDLPLLTGHPLQSFV